MEVQMQCQIVDYFYFFHEFYYTTKTCLKTCQSSAVAINKLIQRCRKVREAQLVNTPLEQFPSLQARLLSTFHSLIQEDIVNIQDQLSTLDRSFEQLCNKHKKLSEYSKEIDIADKTPLVTGTPFQPPLKKILEYAADTLTFGGDIYAQVETSLKILELRKLNTESLVDSFKISHYWNKRIDEIFAYTSFCGENKI